MIARIINTRQFYLMKLSSDGSFKAAVQSSYVNRINSVMLLYSITKSDWLLAGLFSIEYLAKANE